MEFDYLDEIKIEKKSLPPAIRKNSKEDLIKHLLSKNSEEEKSVEKSAVLSDKDIVLYRQAMAREKKLAEQRKAAEDAARMQVVEPVAQTTEKKHIEEKLPADLVPEPAVVEPEVKLKEESVQKTVSKSEVKPKTKAKHKETSESMPLKNDKKKKERPLGNRVLVRYLCRELLVYFAICFCAFFVVFFVNNILVLAETILRKHVKVSAVLKLILYCLPGVVAQSAPFATLVGFLMCLGKMVTDNEIMILRATGQRYRTIFIPVIAMGLLISIFSFVMNDYFLPLGILKFNRLKRQIVMTDPAVEIEPDTVKRMNSTTIVIGSVSDDKVIQDMVFFDTDSEGNDRIIITGQGTVEKSVDDAVLMKFNMGRTSVFSMNRDDRSKFDVLDSQNASFNVFDRLFADATNRISPREMTSLDLWKTIRQMVRENTVTKKRLNQFKLEFNNKFSMPFGSIFFALLAFPLALVFGKRDGLTLGLIFGTFISVMYWAASILGRMFGIKSGWNGFVMMWTPNFVIGVVGILLYLRLRKK